MLLLQNFAILTVALLLLLQEQPTKTALITTKNLFSVPQKTIKFKDSTTTSSEIFCPDIPEARAEYAATVFTTFAAEHAAFFSPKI